MPRVTWWSITAEPRVYLVRRENTVVTWCNKKTVVTWWTQGSLRLPGITCVPSTIAPFLHIHHFFLQSSCCLITVDINFNNQKGQSESSPGSDEFPNKFQSPPSTEWTGFICSCSPKNPRYVLWPPCTAPHYPPRHWHGHWRHALLRQHGLGAAWRCSSTPDIATNPTSQVRKTSHPPTPKLKLEQQVRKSG